MPETPLLPRRIQHVRIAELHVATTGILKAILGSCVAIAMINRRTGVCGLAHCLLPTAPADALINDARYADRAIGNLLKAVSPDYDGRGETRRDLTAFLSGGSRMMKNNQARATIGDMNLSSARASFAMHRIRFTERGIGELEGCTVELDCDEKLLECKPILPFGDAETKPEI